MIAGSRPPGVYFEAIGEAWTLVLKDLGHWVAATIVYFVAYYAMLLPINLILTPMIPRAGGGDFLTHFAGVFVLQMILMIIPISVQFTMFVGMVSMGVRKARGEYINVGMMFEPFRKFGTVAGTGVLYYVILLAAFCALVLPSFYFAPVLLIMPVVAYLKGVGPIEALGLTFDACKAHWGGLLALTLLLGIVMVAGFCACGIGLLVAWPVYCVTLGIHYRAFFESDFPTIANGY